MFTGAVVGYKMCIVVSGRVRKYFWLAVREYVQHFYIPQLVWMCDGAIV